MSNPKSSSSTTETGKARKRQGLPELLETIAIAGSAVGVGVAVITKQVLYAATPLTIAMALGVLNRQRFQKQVQEQYLTSLSQLHQSLKTFPDPVNLEPILQKVVSLEQAHQMTVQQIEHLQREMRYQAKPKQMAQMHKAIASLRVDVERMQSFVAQQHERERQVVAQIEQLKTWYEQLPAPQQTTEYKRVENAIALLHRELAVIKGRLVPLEATDLNGVQASIVQLQSYLQQLAGGVQPIKRKQRDMVQRLFPRIIDILNELRQPETPQEARKAVVHRPPPPIVNHTMRSQPHLGGNGQPNNSPGLPDWQARMQADSLRRRDRQRYQQQQRQGDSSV
ncbi:MAG: hypothetical protein J7641_22735 [Cyanobacteria bacterium SID2]|nr:hypothetical protein [Cyanobacteria bacterium SID2]MBP0005233.1 hypothetical protein [Cyanobacteria bacterium SBC]